VERARKPDRRGWVRAEIPIESVSHAAEELLKLRAEVEVLAPADLREQMRAISAEMASLYSSRRAARRTSKARTR
jgi:predicted DNA-binding transcriptional regulator YafY